MHVCGLFCVCICCVVVNVVVVCCFLLRYGRSCFFLSEFDFSFVLLAEGNIPFNCVFQFLFFVVLLLFGLYESLQHSLC